MKKIFFVLSVTCLLSASAGAATWPGPSYPGCAFGVSYDSFGRGIEDGFKSTALRAKLLDENCYRWGVEAGRKTHATGDGSLCEYSFGRGRTDGYALEVRPEDACYSQGYKAGEAALDIDAREGNAPATCQDAYNKGAQDFRDGNPGTTPDGTVAAHCYHLGRWDTSGFTR